jgi:hypothetical protein
MHEGGGEVEIEDTIPIASILKPSMAAEQREEDKRGAGLMVLMASKCACIALARFLR